MAYILTGSKVANADEYDIIYKYKDSEVLTIENDGGTDESTFYFNLTDTSIEDKPIKQYLIPGREYKIFCKAKPAPNHLIWTDSDEKECGALKMPPVKVTLKLIKNVEESVPEENEPETASEETEEGERAEPTTPETEEVTEGYQFLYSYENYNPNSQEQYDTPIKCENVTKLFVTLQEVSVSSPLLSFQNITKSLGDFWSIVEDCKNDEVLLLELNGSLPTELTLTINISEILGESSQS